MRRVIVKIRRSIFILVFPMPLVITIEFSVRKQAAGCVMSRLLTRAVLSLSRLKQTGLVTDAECDAATLAVGVQAFDPGEVPDQSAGADAGADAGRGVRFGSERRVSARAVTSVDFAYQRQPVVEPVAGRQTEKQHVVLRERADVPGGVNRR